MKNCALYALLLLALPGFATIQQRTGQSPISQFNTVPSPTCSNTFGATPTATDLFVVWTYWSTTSSNQLTAGVADTFGNKFPSAVGPTLQVASNTYAQIFYVPNLSSPGTGSDKLTVTYYLNGVQTNATTSGCVFVEYSGADPNYPLDSVSAGSSYAAAALYDSGTAAPANANLLVFAGGTSDATGATITAESGFTPIVTNGNSITEQFINSSGPNNTLQRAQACTSTSVPCPATPTGNWVMQMAIFRDASWTVGGGWSPARPPQVINAAQYPGVDPCAQLVAAEAGNETADIVLPIAGGGQTAPTPCSVDPLSGFTSGGRVTITSVGNGNSVVLAVNSPVHISSSQTLEAPAGHATESSGVMIAASPTFQSLAANRLWTNSGGNTFAVVAEGSTPGCLRLTYYNSSTTPVNYQWVIRGAEPDVQLSGFSNPAMNGNFRVVAGNASGGWGDPFCVISPATHANGPTNSTSSPYASFVIFNPAAATYTCSGTGSSTCNLYNGSTLVSTAQVQGITYLICNGPCPTDTVGTSGTCASSDASCALTLLGGNGAGTPISQGGILKNIGVMITTTTPSTTPGVGGMFCLTCQEGSGWINDTTVVARVPGPVAAKFSAGASGGLGSTGNTSQNMYTFQGFEDYCNDNKVSCFSSSEGANYSFTGLSVTSMGLYSGLPTGLPTNAFAGYQFTILGLPPKNQTCIVASSTSTGTFTVTPETVGGTVVCAVPTTMGSSGSATGVLGLHVGFICNDDWDRTCIDNLTANYQAPITVAGNKSPAVWVNGTSDPTASNQPSGGTGPEVIGRINGQSYQELLLIGDQEPTKGVSVASVRINSVGSKYAAIISCNFNGNGTGTVTCPATGVTTPNGGGNRTSDIAISNADGGANATIWDQLENPLPGPLPDCIINNNTTPGCWTDATILDWKMTNCNVYDSSCTGPGISVHTTSNQFPNQLSGGLTMNNSPVQAAVNAQSASVSSAITLDMAAR